MSLLVEVRFLSTAPLFSKVQFGEAASWAALAAGSVGLLRAVVRAPGVGHLGLRGGRWFRIGWADDRRGLDDAVAAFARAYLP